MGGGLRQAGSLAAAGLVALKKMPERLKEDYENALFLGEQLAKIPGINVKREDIHINMVFFSIKDSGQDDQKLVAALKERGIKANPAEDGLMRFVTHYGINKEDIKYVVDTMKHLLSCL